MDKLLLTILSAVLCGNVMASMESDGSELASSSAASSFSDLDTHSTSGSESYFYGADTESSSDEWDADYSSDVAAGNHITKLPWDCERYDEVPDWADTPRNYQSVEWQMSDVLGGLQEVISEFFTDYPEPLGEFPNRDIQALDMLCGNFQKLLSVLRPGTEQYNALLNCSEKWNEFLPRLYNELERKRNTQEEGYSEQIVTECENFWNSVVPTFARILRVVYSEFFSFVEQKNCPKMNTRYYNDSFVDDSFRTIYGAERAESLLNGQGA